MVCIRGIREIRGYSLSRIRMKRFIPYIVLLLGLGYLSSYAIRIHLIEDWLKLGGQLFGRTPTHSAFLISATNGFLLL